MFGEEWSVKQCGLSTQKEDVPDCPPGDAEERKKESIKIDGIKKECLDPLQFRQMYFAFWGWTERDGQEVNVFSNGFRK